VGGQGTAAVKVEGAGLAAYVSGHGFGHATRVSEVLRAIREREPALPITVVGSAPERLYREAVREPLFFRARECDVGLAQRGALIIDEEETVRRWHAFKAGAADWIATEAAWLRSARVGIILADIPHLAFAAASAAAVPALGLANFSWDWIYRRLAHPHPELAEAADHCAAAYRSCELLLQLPFAGDLSAFPRREPIALVARRPGVTREEARRRLALDDRPTVLASFGGLGLADFRLALDRLERYRFIVSEETAAAKVRTVRVSDLDAMGLRYIDLIAAVDVVLSKPGYGIVSDCIAARTRFLYTDRGDFAEYQVMVREMPNYLPVAHVTHEELAAGRLVAALDRVLGAQWPAAPDLGGAETAAERLLARMRRTASG
jgi:hypothetical protein